MDKEQRALICSYLFLTLFVACLAASICTEEKNTHKGREIEEFQF